MEIRRPGRLSVNLTKPKRSKFELDSGVVFPTEHLKRILAAAEAGENLLEVKVYDGSETGEKFMKRQPISGGRLPIPPSRKRLTFRNSTIFAAGLFPSAILKAAKKDDAPSYILSFDLYENGISRALKLDYGDFVLAGEMSSLELLNEPACAK